MRAASLLLLSLSATFAQATGILGLQVAVSAEAPVERDWSSFGMAVASPAGFLEADPLVVVQADSPFWSELTPAPISDRLIGDVATAASAWNLGDWTTVGAEPSSSWGLMSAPATAPVAPPVAVPDPGPRRDYGGGRLADYGLEPAIGRDNLRAWGYDGR